MKKQIGLFFVLILIFVVSSFLLRSFVPEPISGEMIVMGTVGRISIIADSSIDDSRARDLINKAFQIIKDYEGLWSNYSAQSELSSINSRAYPDQFRITTPTFEIIAKALEFSKLTDGVFDVTATSLHEPDGYDKISLGKRDSTIKFRDARTKIDLGGIATGFAIDKAVEFLNSNGVSNYLIDIGGDIYAKGKNQLSETWQIGIRNPQDQDDILQVVAIDGVAVTTSGNYVKKHIIDPASGELADSDMKSVTVIARTCTEADVLATAFFIMDKTKTKEFIDSYGKYLEVFFAEVRDDKVLIENYRNKENPET